MAEFKKPEPLKIKCTASDCDNDLHCFKATRKMAQADRGRCRACGADVLSSASGGKSDDRARRRRRSGSRAQAAKRPWRRLRHAARD